MFDSNCNFVQVLKSFITKILKCKAHLNVFLSDESLLLKTEIDQLKNQQCFNLINNYLHVVHNIHTGLGF